MNQKINLYKNRPNTDLVYLGLDHCLFICAFLVLLKNSIRIFYDFEY
jgi:hypothetical protein